MNVKILFAVMVLVCLPAAVMAQQAAVQKTDNYVLTTNPPGATAYFYGDYNLVVNTPANLPPNLSGKYRVKIDRPGYETWKGDLSFLPGSPNSVTISLNEKTRFKAGLRSLFIPGWGQHYSGSTTRGAVFTIGVLSAGTILFFSDRSYQDKRNTYDIASLNYANASSIEDRIQLKAAMDAAQSNAFKAQTDRRRVFYAVVGLWAYNVFDSMIFFSEGKAYYPTVTTTDGKDAALSLVIKF